MFFGYLLKFTSFIFISSKSEKIKGFAKKIYYITDTIFLEKDHKAFFLKFVVLALCKGLRWKLEVTFCTLSLKFEVA